MTAIASPVPIRVWIQPEHCTVYDAGRWVENPTYPDEGPPLIKLSKEEIGSAFWIIGGDGSLHRADGCGCHFGDVVPPPGFMHAGKLPYVYPELEAAVVPPLGYDPDVCEPLPEPGLALALVVGVVALWLMEPFQRGR